ncbi:MAG: UvrD-helicase domain-containing protein [Clostridia bacterium]|nr:UvrD-helicase domain-containing protein [Clostridia bacterium]
MERIPNEEQLRVINELDRNIILFASAGTGKTFTVANRVRNILALGKALPEEILCMTFTIKACNEMKEDIQGYAGEAGKGVEVRTIHGFCYQLLREENRRKKDRYGEATVCDEVDAESLLRSILSSQYGLWEAERTSQTPFSLSAILADDEQAFAETAGEGKVFDIYSTKTGLRNFVSEVKHCREEKDIYTGDDEADYAQAFAYFRSQKQERYENAISYFARFAGRRKDDDFDSAMSRYAGKLIATYDRHLQRSNQVDFDDLITYASRHLRDKETVARWSKRYKYIIVDEMQDTSELEYSVLRRLFGTNNIMLCGDYFQTIYEWRGSRPDSVLGGFAKEFSAQVMMFSQNYRATKTLANATFGYLCNTYPDLVGKACPQKLAVHSKEEGETIDCYGFDNPRQEAAQIFSYAQRALKSGRTGLCVMARSNPYIATLTRTFAEINAGLPEAERVRFFTAEEDYAFFRRSVVKDVLATVKLLLNKTDAVSMERLSAYMRGVGTKTVEVLRLLGELGLSITSFLLPDTYEYGDPYHSLLTAYEKGGIVIYDTETTGLDLAKDEPVQISAVKIGKEGEVLEIFDRLVIPSVPIARAAYETHGFDMEYLRTHGGVELKRALEEFSAFARGCVLVGHNGLRFDAPLIRRCLKESGLPPLATVAEYDTLVIAKRFLPRLPDFKLSTLCSYYGIVNEAAHNALGDVTATGKVLVKLIREEVLPTALERRNAVEKYRARFEKFYEFYKEASARLQEDGESLPPFLVESLRLRKKYDSAKDLQTVDDLLAGLKVPPKTDAESFFRGYIADAALANGRLDLLMQKHGGVPVITVHQAKGCEFDTVVLAGAGDDHFPGYYARESGREEEEKKVFYVAITRAKRKLVLTRSADGYNRTTHPSPYFYKIPQSFVRTNRGWED